MELQFYGANCVSLSYKGTRMVLDDNLAELGGKSVLKPEDVALYSGSHATPSVARLVFDGPGEYEVADISIIGITARAQTDEAKQQATVFKLIAGDQNILFTGHIYPELNDTQLEKIGPVDIMVVPIGGHGYTVDATGALKLIKEIEPKLVVPTYYADKALKFPVPPAELAEALKELGMEPKETVAKLRLKPGELSDITQLIVLEKS
jgi:L-ascorbate metabolism protein UlaG (beta-lactamase superfamily)